MSGSDEGASCNMLASRGSCAHQPEHAADKFSGSSALPGLAGFSPCANPAPHMRSAAVRGSQHCHRIADACCCCLQAVHDLQGSRQGQRQHQQRSQQSAVGETVLKSTASSILPAYGHRLQMEGLCQCSAMQCSAVQCIALPAGTCCLVNNTDLTPGQQRMASAVSSVSIRPCLGIGGNDPPGGVC